MEISTIVNDAHTRPAKFTSTFFGGDVSYRVRVSVRNLELCYSLKIIVRRQYSWALLKKFRPFSPRNPVGLGSVCLDSGGRIGMSDCFCLVILFLSKFKYKVGAVCDRIGLRFYEIFSLSLPLSTRKILSSLEKHTKLKIQHTSRWIFPSFVSLNILCDVQPPSFEEGNPTRTSFRNNPFIFTNHQSGKILTSLIR
uniref:Uncharacterized protein n=1 Tax=Cucumis melo TaxID=3656 RepID=A0A9I9E831_CUCME